MNEEYNPSKEERELAARINGYLKQAHESLKETGEVLSDIEARIQDPTELERVRQQHGNLLRDYLDTLTQSLDEVKKGVQDIQSKIQEIGD
jgi:hypothetical protein